MIKKIINLISLLLCIITCTIFGLYIYLHHSIIPKYEQKLLKLVNNHEKELNTYLNQQEKNAIELSEEITILNLLTNPAPITADEQKKLSSLIAQHQQTMGFKNILLIDKKGTICFSTTKKNITDININQPSYTNASIGKSYERASMTLTNDVSHFNFNDLLQEPALCISIPILKQKKFIGVLTYQLDQEKIYLITNQYIGLEKTGEVVLAKKEDEHIIFLSATRNDPDLAFKKRLFVNDPPLAIQASVVGKEGSGISIDYRGKRILGAWRFIPRIDWGMMVKIDLEEILQPTIIVYKIFLFFLFIFIISLLISIYLFYPLIEQKLKIINHRYPCNKIPSLLKNPLFIALLFFCGLTIKNIILSRRETSFTIETAKNKVKESIIQNSDAIETMLEKIAFIGQSIADDLRTHYLATEDIATRIKRDVTENRIITKITVLFAPYTYNKETEMYVQSTDNIPQTENLFKTQWYRKAVEQGHVWITHSNKNEQDNQPTAIYARTFTDKNNQLNGVIAITFSLTDIINLAEYSGAGQTGYSMIMDNNGAFIFHPIATLVQSKTTLLQYAQSKGNEELATIAQKIGDGTPQMNSYASESTKEQFWIYTQPIKINGWIIGSLFSEDEIILPADTTRHYYFWILIWAVVTLLLFLTLLWHYSLFSLMYYDIIVNAILILALLTTWYIIKQTTTINRESRTIITDQSALNKFLNDLNEEAERKHEALPINIPCGILLYSLTIQDPTHIIISGYIWNKYNKIVHKHIGRGMELPQAVKLSFGIPLTSEADNETEATTWNIQGTLFQEQNYAQYPFDQQQIRIILEHKDIEKNIILTPDLTAYKKISPESTPGLDKEFSLAGFTIEQTFFEYHKINPSTNFGFKEYGKVTDNYQLIYNAIMNRNLLDPFVLYILPLLVILFSLFTTLLLTRQKTEPLTTLGAYSGLFFALILLQRSLREQHPAGTTLYIEYAFFYTYITIILLIFHTILTHYHKTWLIYRSKSLYFMKIFFWPFQLISWLITTLIIFY